MRAVRIAILVLLLAGGVWLWLAGSRAFGSQTFTCEPDPAGCAATFSDPDHATDARDALYYVRAYEAPAPAINAGNLRCEYDASGACVNVSPCGPDPDDECLAEHEPRAWSSPIFVDHPEAVASR